MARKAYSMTRLFFIMERTFFHKDRRVSGLMESRAFLRFGKKMKARMRMKTPMMVV